MSLFNDLMLQICLGASFALGMAITTRSCQSSGMCFQAYTMGDGDGYIGFILPPRASHHFPQEFILNVTTPVDYGFIAVGQPGFSNSQPVNDTELRPVTLLMFVICSLSLDNCPLAASPDGVFPMTAARTQLSMNNGNDSLIPALGKGLDPQMTFFNQSQIGPITTSFTLRCQRCVILPDGSGHVVQLEGMYDAVRDVEYLDPMNLTFRTGMEDSVKETFLLDIDSARVDEDTYANLLKFGDII
ncbi:hypothetical protein BDZ97DRAFT_1751133 [Flammula alnicola]|nr:hypothetical protein BDZ97DRAFT_1751133 [Flammula alnicola]